MAGLSSFLIWRNRSLKMLGILLDVPAPEYEIAGAEMIEVIPLPDWHEGHASEIVCGFDAIV